MNNQNDAIFRRNLSKRLDKMSAEIKDLGSRMEKLDQMVLHCIDHLDTLGYPASLASESLDTTGEEWEGQP